MPDLQYWIERGKEMVADRERRIKRAKGWKFDTVAVHGLYDVQQAMEYNNASIMEPVYLTPAQAYHDSGEMEAGLSYQMPNWCYLTASVILMYTALRCRCGGLCRGLCKFGTVNDNSGWRFNWMQINKGHEISHPVKVFI